jgi:hypothetical protein
MPSPYSTPFQRGQILTDQASTKLWSDQLICEQVPLNAVIRGRVIGLHEDSYAWGEESEDADNSCDFGASVDGEPRSDGSNSDDPWEFSF